MLSKLSLCCMSVVIRLAFEKTKSSKIYSTVSPMFGTENGFKWGWDLVAWSMLSLGSM